MQLPNRLAAGACLAVTTAAACGAPALAGTANLTVVKPPPDLRVKHGVPRGHWLTGALLQTSSCAEVAFRRETAPHDPTYDAVESDVRGHRCARVTRYVLVQEKVVPANASRVTVRAKNGTFSVPVRRR